MLSPQQDHPLRILFAFDKQIELSVFLIHGGIDAPASLLAVKQGGLCIVPEILRPAVIDGHRPVIVLRAAVRIVQHVVPLFRIEQDIRRPDTARFFIPDGNHFLLGPVHKIVGFPVRQVAAAMEVDVPPGMPVFPAHAVAQAQVRRENMKPPVRPAPDDRHVPHPVIPVVRPEDRAPFVQGFPAESVPAEREINLFPLRGRRFPEMDKKIAAHRIHPNHPFPARQRPTA